MKLIIQIPCYNETETLGLTVAELPRSVPGFDSVEFLVVDDGSTDDTRKVAEALGVDHVVRHATNLGLARSFQTGIDACLRFGADVIVNTDADNQYPARYIPELTAPILECMADIVISDRQTDSIAHFSPMKRFLQRLGTSTVRRLSGTNVGDAPSGFRAYSREAALQLNILTHFSYTLDTVVQAGKLRLNIVNLPIETNPPTRPSRLHRSNTQFVLRQMSTILRLYAFYEPLKTFALLAMPFLVFGSAAWARFIYLYATGQTGVSRYVQSLTMGTGLLILGGLILLFALLADIGAKHRHLTQQTLYRLRKLESRLPVDDRHQADRL